MASVEAIERFISIDIGYGSGNCSDYVSGTGYRDASGYGSGYNDTSAYGDGYNGAVGYGAGYSDASGNADG